MLNLLTVQSRLTARTLPYRIKVKVCDHADVPCRVALRGQSIGGSKMRFKMVHKVVPRSGLRIDEL